jgi:hypothetical protein
LPPYKTEFDFRLPIADFRLLPVKSQIENRQLILILSDQSTANKSFEHNFGKKKAPEPRQVSGPAVSRFAFEDCIIGL